MNAKIIILACALASCAHRAEPVFYTVSWSKPGASQQDWTQASHECRVEEHQRTALDSAAHHQAVEEDEIEFKNSMRSGLLYHGGRAAYVSKQNVGKNYWSECMLGHSWHEVGRATIPRQTDPTDKTNILDYDEMGIDGDQQIFKPSAEAAGQTSSTSR